MQGMSPVVYKSVGIFAKAEKAAQDFLGNLFLSSAISQCVHLLLEAEDEYQEALCRGDEEIIAQKQLKVQACKSSVLLTACIFEEVDEIST